MTAEAIRIDRVVLHRIRLPFRSPFVTSHGAETDKHATIVQVDCGGVTGWGECSALQNPTYTYEYADGAFAMLRDALVPALLAKHRSSVVGHPMASASIEAAMVADTTPLDVVTAIDVTAQAVADDLGGEPLIEAIDAADLVIAPSDAPAEVAPDTADLSPSELRAVVEACHLWDVESPLVAAISEAGVDARRGARRTGRGR